MTTSTGPDRSRHPATAPAGHGWRAVSIVLVGAFMALLDTTIVNVALPSIRTGLHAPAASLEWIVAGYALAYGLALVPAGRAGDRFGHKPLFLLGLTVFTLASVACGIAQHPDRDRHRPDRAGARGRDVLPGHLRHHPAVLHRAAALQGVRRARRDHRRVDRARPAARRPDHRRGRGPGRVALGVPGQPVHRAGHGAARGLAAAPLPGARARRGFDPVGLALLTATPAAVADPAGRGAAGGLARLVLGLLRRLRRDRPPCWPPGRCARTGAAATRCSSPGCSGRCRSPPGRSSRWSTSPASPACSSRCRSCGRKDSGTAR